MKKIIIGFTILFSVFSFSQATVSYALIDKKIAAIPVSYRYSTDSIAKYINGNFKTENDKIRAVFYWTASNISYDIKNMFAVNFEETPQDRITKTLKTQKGICGDYAAIFNEIAALVGIKSVVISGYTKQNGKIDTVSHAWCASKIENKWYVFDPTWGSGFVTSGKFVKKMNDYYFKVEPSKIISSHIPFDYLWQFLNYPITNEEFYESRTQINKTKKYFDFDKEIDKLASLSEIDQQFESTERIAKSGFKNSLIMNYYQNQKQNLAVRRQNINIDKLNLIVEQMNQAVALLNDFISYRNNKFKPVLDDDEINNMIQKPKAILTKCQGDIYGISSIGSDNKTNLMSIKKSVESNLALAVDQESFVKNYLSKSKIVRKTMFSKVSWFGIPLN
jgi:hypothetical protein